MPAPPGTRPILLWLYTGCALIACMVAIGGITRLTGSGLSITEWKPIMGALPPMDAAEWNEAFDKYKAIPEYRLINQHLDLPGFKRIFFWEYLHRNWGRFMSVVFAVPFVIFLRRGWIKGWLLRRTLAILVAGGLVGALGWFMVMSGLEKNPDVSQYRLAIHLVAAFSVFALVQWTAHDLLHGRRWWRATTSTGRYARLLLLLLLVQIVWGAFTAGLDAGRVHNTWPLMNGQFLPDTATGHGSLLADFTGHRDGVQFVHRNLAWLVAAAVLVFAWRVRKDPVVGRIANSAAGMVLLQFVLGVATLLTQVSMWLGVLHQLGALILLLIWIRLLHATGSFVDPKAVNNMP